MCCRCGPKKQKQANNPPPRQKKRISQMLCKLWRRGEYESMRQNIYQAAKKRANLEKSLQNNVKGWENTDVTYLLSVKGD